MYTTKMEARANNSTNPQILLWRFWNYYRILEIELALATIIVVFGKQIGTH
jgi:hypothetical protein